MKEWNGEARKTYALGSGGWIARMNECAFGADNESTSREVYILLGKVASKQTQGHDVWSHEQ
jgi:hypothetical protein